MLIKNATRLKNVHDWFKKKKVEKGEKERGRREQKPFAIYFLCVLLPERQSANQQFVESFKLQPANLKLYARNNVINSSCKYIPVSNWGSLMHYTKHLGLQ